MTNLLQQTETAVFTQAEFMNHTSMAGFAFFFLAIFLTGMIIQFLLAYLVYKDALNRGNPNALLWFIVVFISSIMGIVIYFLFVVNNTGTSTPKYFTPNQSRPEPNITQKTPSGALNYCKNCGSKVDTGKFCSDCGSQLN